MTTPTPPTPAFPAILGPETAAALANAMNARPMASGSVTTSAQTFAPLPNIELIADEPEPPPAAPPPCEVSLLGAFESVCNDVNIAPGLAVIGLGALALLAANGTSKPRWRRHEEAAFDSARARASGGAVVRQQVRLSHPDGDRIADTIVDHPNGRSTVIEAKAVARLSFAHVDQVRDTADKNCDLSGRGSSAVVKIQQRTKVSQGVASAARAMGVRIERA